MVITKNTTISEVIEKNPDKIKVLQENLQAMCLGCPHSQMETLEEAAEHHQIDLDCLLSDLNKQ